MGSSFDANGFFVARGVLSRGQAGDLATAIDSSFEGDALRSRRNLLAVPEALAFARSAAADRLVKLILGPNAKPVRGILFDKTGEANWRVGWHQDQVIAVAEQVDAPGFTAWSEKEGVAHVKPPAEVLERMVTLRLHLDDCPADNGPLEVIPGSHRHGLLAGEQIESLRRSSEPAATCTAAEGDAVLMRPLLVHASSKATNPRRRRVLRLEYAGDELPGKLAWPNWS